MPVLSRRVDERIVIAQDIVVTVVAMQEGKVRLGFTAPHHVLVDRQEVHERRFEFAQAVGQLAEVLKDARTDETNEAGHP